MILATRCLMVRSDQIMFNPHEILWNTMKCHPNPASRLGSPCSPCSPCWPWPRPLWPQPWPSDSLHGRWSWPRAQVPPDTGGECWVLIATIAGMNMKCRNPQWNVGNIDAISAVNFSDTCRIEMLWPSSCDHRPKIGLGYHMTVILNLNYGSRKHGLWAWTPRSLVCLDLDQTSKPLKPTNWRGTFKRNHHFGAPMKGLPNYQKPHFCRGLPLVLQIESRPSFHAVGLGLRVPSPTTALRPLDVLV